MLSAPILCNPMKDDPKLKQLMEQMDSANSKNRRFHQPKKATTISAPSPGNPIKDNPKLQQLLKNLDSVKSKDQFQRWRNSFLKEFEVFLDDAGSTAKAKLIFADFADSAANLAKLTTW